MAYRILLLCLFAVAVSYTVTAQHIELDPWSAAEAVNSRTLPTLYGSALAITLAVMFLQQAPRPKVPRAVSQPLLLCLCLLGFVILVSVAGIWPALTALLATSMWVMGERHPAPIAGWAIGLPLGGWLVVERLMGVYVPGPF